ncbi:MAG: response regulator, partial [Xanthomonadales bacterium]|nr:response regulator [Xanthomonadales bacterium]
AKPGNEGLDRIRRHFWLEDQVLDQEALLRARGSVSGRNRELFESLGQAVKDELAEVKDALDLELRTGEVNPEHREQCLDSLNRLQDTLRMLSLGRIADEFDQLIPAFEESAEAEGDQREPALMALAKQLLLVESALQEQIETLGEPIEESLEDHYIELPPHEFRRVSNHLLDETVASLLQFQEAVKARFGGDASADLDLPLQQVAAALQMIGENETAALSRKLASVTAFLLKNVYAETALDKADLATFTDAVAALELFLARCRDKHGDRDRFRTILENRLALLPDSSEAAERIAAEQAEQAEETPVAAPQPDSAIETVTELTQEAPGEDQLPPEMDHEMLQVFLGEYEEVAESFHHLIPDWLEQLDDMDQLTEIRRGFHTLKGSGRMVGAHELGDFCWQIEELLNSLLEKRIDNFADVAVMVRLAQASLPALKQRLMQQPVGLSRGAIKAIGKHAEYLSTAQSADWHKLREQLPAFLAGMLPDAPPPGDLTFAARPATRDKVKSALASDLRENLAPLQDLLERVSSDHAAQVTREHLRAAHTLTGSLAMAPIALEAEVCRALEGMLEALSINASQFSVDAVFILASTIGHLQAHLDLVEGVSETGSGQDEQALIDQIIALTVQIESGELPPVPVGATPQEEIETPAAVDTPEAPETEQAAEAPVETAAEETVADLDQDIINIFIEEANDVLARSDSLLNEWRGKLDDLSIVRNLQREIHTFKGGARMAGLVAMGDLSHAMESVLEQIANKTLPPSVSAVGALESGCDRLLSWVGQVGRGQLPGAGDAVRLFEQQAQDLADVPVAPPPVKAPQPEEREEQALPESPAQVSNRSEDKSGGSIRVDAELLDSMVNAAGEVSIFRSRLEQQIDTLRSSLGEFDETIARLREQFRKLEIETETQIRSRYKDAADPETEGFDPLELDRFSSMQQLSRGLSESVSDLLNLQEILDEAARQSDHLLNQQSRFTTELQEGLMQTRMVPFGSIAPRLRRLVRTAANETKKQARLQLKMVGTSDQLDRNILERITAPLEHMLRNAIAHGIERPAERKKLDKNAEGEITITVESETTEFTIRISDDGAGINLGAIQEKAVELGLLDENAEPPRQKLLEFILDSGFSTSNTVTGLAGRGVGLDVVNSEIKQIGGSLEIESDAGKGTCFTIRIPFTLAVMQAIGVMAGDNRYLIPLASVGGVARLLPDEYRTLLETDEPVYEFAGEEYPVLELEPLLGEPAQPLGNDTVSLLMIRAGDNKAAFRVPELLGHREIVIKPVGPQISSVPGVLGGTVNADGKVVVILDMGPLIRHALMHGVRPAAVDLSAERPLQTLAMVVDDSITMRKVTSRVLEGHNFEVITAKDGIDATEQMQERVPDLLLLDIEMPRMDGYGVAEHVRSDPRLKHIPIVMITSRSGQKHRDRATQAGANAYLTKPYKESELLSQVNLLLDRED